MTEQREIIATPDEVRELRRILRTLDAIDRAMDMLLEKIASASGDRSELWDAIQKRTGITAGKMTMNLKNGVITVLDKASKSGADTVAS